MVVPSVTVAVTSQVLSVAVFAKIKVNIVVCADFVEDGDIGVEAFTGDRVVLEVHGQQRFGRRPCGNREGVVVDPDRH